MGLFGPNGPLPLVFTEFARERILHHNDHTLRVFSMFSTTASSRLLPRLGHQPAAGLLRTGRQQ